MATFGVNVRGGERLARTMRKAGMDVGVLKQANRQAADTVAGAARGTAPVGIKSAKSRKRYRPGKLSKSVRAGATAKAGVIRAGGGRVPYANAIHWGWPKRNIQAQHFLSEAAIATEPVWVPRYEAHMNKVIKQVRGL